MCPDNLFPENNVLEVPQVAYPNPGSTITG